jgi:hypothetical protein
VFLYDTASDTTSVLMVLEETTSGGRELCAFHSVALGDSGLVAVRASSKLDCADGAEVPREGVFFRSGGLIETAVLEADPAPVGGTTFTSFEDAPAINASDHIAFRATVGGLVSRSGVFVHDPSGATTQVGVLRGDAAPVDGAVGKISSFDLDDADRVVVRSSVIGAATRFGVFAFGASLETALANTSTPPTDLFSPGASYLRISDAGISADGDHLAVKVRIRDREVPRSRRAIIRCTR